jgi:hypothetical protein
MKNKENTLYEELIGRKHPLSYLYTWSCLAKVNVPINQKRKLRPKTMDCIFLGYAHHSITYVDTFIESCDVNFFENIIPMKNLHSKSRLPENVIADTTPNPSKNFMHAEHTLEPVHEEIDTEAPRRSKRRRIEKSFGDDLTVYLVDDTPKIISEAFVSPDAYGWKEVARSEMDTNPTCA